MNNYMRQISHNLKVEFPNRTVKSLKQLNNDSKFTDLDFIMNPREIIIQLSKMDDNTNQYLIDNILSILSSLDTIPKELIDIYKVYSKSGIKIINDSCIDYLSTLDDNSIDCVITDPPYFIDKLDSKWSANNVQSDIPNSHIKHLPKGMKFDKKQTKDLFDFYKKISTVLFKKLKPGGYFLSFSSPRLYHSIAMACDQAGFEVRDMINWVYTQSMPKGMSMDHIIKRLNISNSEKDKLKDKYTDMKTPMLKSCFEPICVCMKPVESSFLKNELKYNTSLIDFSQKVGVIQDRVPANIITTENQNDIYDKNFLVSKPSAKEKGKTNTHITVKPILLMEHLIRIYSKEEALILDPFIGSGTTAIACKNTNRRCIGIDINKKYCDISLDRLFEFGS